MQGNEINSPHPRYWPVFDIHVFTGTSLIVRVAHPLPFDERKRERVSVDGIFSVNIKLFNHYPLSLISFSNGRGVARQRRGEGVKFREVKITMKQSVIWEKHTDFISNRQEILLWEFSISELQRHYEVEIYSLPVEIELFRALKAMAASGNKQLRERSFTIFMGDCGPGFELFAVGVPAKTSSRVTELITACFENIRGYETMEYGQIPFVPLIPCYRYDHGGMFEYTNDYFMAGKRRDDDAVISGMGVFYRMYEPAEGLGVRERYCKS